ncbi:MAG: hypothetical protein NXI31_11490 [bacterium]|nr:hypothetical protein [bacterium]
MKHRRLLCGRDPNESPLATMLVAAIAAHTGLRAAGTPHPDAATPWLEQRATLADLLTETGADPRAARRALAELEDAGTARLTKGIRGRVEAQIACPAILAARWTVVRRRVAFDQAIRSARLAPPYALLAAWVAGQTRRQHASTRATRAGLADILGMPVRTVRRALAAVDSSGLVQRWVHADRIVLAAPRDRCKNGPPTGAETAPPRTDLAPVQNRSRTGADSDPHRCNSGPPPVQERSPTGANSVPEAPFSPFTPCTPLRACARGGGAAHEDAEAEPRHEVAGELCEILAGTQLRSRTPARFRNPFLDARSAELAADGMQPGDLQLLIEAAGRFTNGDQAALLGTWLDNGRAWREVLIDLRHEQKERVRRAQGPNRPEPLLAASVLDAITSSTRAQQ